MTKTRVLSLAALLAALLFLLALPASAQCDPTSDPSCRLSPLQSRQVNPAASAAEGETTDLSAPGVPAAVAVEMPMITAESLSGVGASVASSEHRAPSGQMEVQSSALGASAMANAAPSFEGFDLRMRYQDPSDVSCGVQALGMALDGLRAEGLEAPSSSALLGFLQGQSMMYDFGTGVEELAYAAGSFGFKGSQPFHGWTIEDLRPELVGGRPVVVALGSNGEGVPGHFVTVTGFSADGKWVSYNDPTLGKVTQSVDDFEALWAAQGHSGVSVRSPAALPAGTPDNLPLLALLAGVMALVSTTPLGKFRLGVGGKVIHSGSGANSSAPPYPAPAGKRWRAKTVPVYDTKTVQEGWTTVSQRVPIKKSVREQVGTRTYYEKIPQFKTIRVRDGYRWVAHKVPKYKTVRYVRYYRYRTQRRPTPWGWSYYRKRVPVYGSRRVRVGTKTKWRKVPKYTTKEVPNGYRTIERSKPVYDWVEKVVGYETVEKRVPWMVEKQVQVGTEVEWDLEEAAIAADRHPMPVLNCTPPAPFPEEGTPQPMPFSPFPAPVETPEPTATGTPEPMYFDELNPNNNGAELPTLPSKYWKYLPSTRIPLGENRRPIFNYPMIEIGLRSSKSINGNHSEVIGLTTTSWGPNIGPLSIGTSFDGKKISLGVKRTLASYRIEESNSQFRHSQSIGISLEWNGWNTETSFTYNFISYAIKKKDDDPLPSVSASEGVYLREKPLQVSTGLFVSQMVIGNLTAGGSVLAPVLADLLKGGLTLEPLAP